MAISLPIVSKFDDKGVKNADDSIGKLQGTLKTFAGVAIAAFSIDAIVDFGRSAITAAEDAQVANNRLDAIAKSMGLFGDQTAGVTKRIKGFADQLALTTGVEDEAIKAAQAQLLTFKDLAVTADDAGGAFDRATKAVLDLSAAGLGSLDTSAVQLGKALQDPIKGIAALGRAGVTFSEDQKAFIQSLVESGDLLGAQDYLLSAIETQVGGTAEATATASDKMKVAWGEIQETVGALLLPAFEAFAQWVVENFPTIQAEIENAGESIRVMWEKVQPVFAKLKRFFEEEFLPAMEVLGPKLEELGATFVEALDQTFQGLNTTVDDGAESSGAFVDALAGLIDAFTWILQLGIDTDQALRDLGDYFVGETSLQEFTNKMLAMGGVFGWAAEQGTMWGNNIRDNVNRAVTFFSEFPGKIQVALAGAFSWLINVGRDLVDGFVKGIQDNWWKVLGVLTGGVTTAIEAAAKLLGIASPSKVFMSMGHDVTAGFVKGLQDGQIDITKAMTGLAGTVDTSFSAAVNAGGVLDSPVSMMASNGGSSSAQYSITVNAGMGVNGSQVGQEIIKAISQYERGNGAVFARA